jgi:hypothetical protein
MSSELLAPSLLFLLVAINLAILILQITDRRERRELIEQLIALHEQPRPTDEWRMPRLRTFEDEAS